MSRHVCMSLASQGGDILKIHTNSGSHRSHFLRESSHGETRKLVTSDTKHEKQHERRSSNYAKFCVGGTSVTDSGPHGNICIVARFSAVCFSTRSVFLYSACVLMQDCMCNAEHIRIFGKPSSCLRMFWHACFLLLLLLLSVLILHRR